MAGRKQIQDARVVVLRLDGVDPADAAQSLKDLGIVHAVGLADVGSLSVHIEGGKVDVLVVSSPPSAGIVQPSVLPLPPQPPEAALKAGIPCLLLLPGTSRSAARMALAAGYAAVMSVDAAPRQVYRRIGALMQRVRRIGRAHASVRGAPAGGEGG